MKYILPVKTIYHPTIFAFLRPLMSPPLKRFFTTGSLLHHPEINFIRGPYRSSGMKDLRGSVLMDVIGSFIIYYLHKRSVWALVAAKGLKRSRKVLIKNSLQLMLILGSPSSIGIKPGTCRHQTLLFEADYWR